MLLDELDWGGLGVQKGKAAPPNRLPFGPRLRGSTPAGDIEAVDPEGWGRNLAPSSLAWGGRALGASLAVWPGVQGLPDAERPKEAAQPPDPQ